MKKLTTITGVLVICISYFLFLTYSTSPKEEPKILSQLEDRGVVKGTREFQFSIKNVGETQVTLEFPTWLEYNYFIDTPNKSTVKSEDVKVQNVDLQEDKTTGRVVILKPNEEIKYRLQITAPKGEYELGISSATGYGGFQKCEFDIGVSQ